MLYYSRRNEILHENNVSNFFSCVLRTFIPKYGKIGVANFYCCNSHLISIFRRTLSTLFSHFNLSWNLDVIALVEYEMELRIECRRIV